LGIPLKERIGGERRPKDRVTLQITLIKKGKRNMGIPTSSISISFLTQSILRLLGSFPVFLTQSWNFSFKHDAPQKNPNGIWLKRT